MSTLFVGEIIMKVIKMWTILMVMLLFALPVSAQEESTTIVKPASGTRPTNIGIDTAGSITQGETDWYQQYIPGVPQIVVDLNWYNNPSNSLALTIYQPDGVVLGPYHDADDVITNGRIYLSLTDSNGEDLPGGTWRFKVYGEKVQGIQNYEFNVYY